ncbi:TlpA disulfide reductase family protein [Plantactinospora sp. GCM10030261]|uniref:TlpA disulfide reductase family protein n=1 Tax=Plantactinospora sp. GCM10030261 TaxID=3273420 RepID=UPI003615AB1C
MPYLAATVALVGLIAVVNLLLTIGVVRRLREQTTELADLRSRPPMGDAATTLPAGANVAPFEASAVDGRTVTLASLGERPLIGFLSPSCKPCAERLPGFVRHAAERPGGRDSVLAVIAGTPEASADYIEQLSAVATVVVEPDLGPVQQAFGVTGYPSFLLIRDGEVDATDYDLGPIVERDTEVETATVG